MSTDERIPDSESSTTDVRDIRTVNPKFTERRLLLECMRRHPSFRKPTEEGKR